MAVPTAPRRPWHRNIRPEHHIWRHVFRAFSGIWQVLRWVLLGFIVFTLGTNVLASLVINGNTGLPDPRKVAAIKLMLAHPLAADLFLAGLLVLALIARRAHLAHLRAQQRLGTGEVPSAVSHYFSPKDIARIRRAGSALRDQRLCQFLKWKYASETMLVRNGEMYPIAIFPAPASQTYSPDSVLLSLDKRETTDVDLHPTSEEYRGLVARMGRPLDDRRTFAMRELSVSDRLGIHAQMGSYFRALDTCDSLEWEILSRAGELKRSDAHSFKAFDGQLSLRHALHAKVANPVRDGSHRSAAIAISTLVAYNDEGSTYLLVRKRSAKGVAVHAGLVHVIPSFMFQPATVYVDEEFSVTHNVYREYLEELFNRPELEDMEGDWRYFYGDPRLQYLRQLIDTNQAELLFSGVAVNLLNLRPEICTVLYIRSPEWSLRHARSAATYERFHFNFEWASILESADNVESLVGRIAFAADMTDEELIRRAPLHPDQMVPPGAAAFWLGVDLLRQLPRSSSD